jgi:hypothetical protein
MVPAATTAPTSTATSGRIRPNQSTPDPDARLYRKSYGKESKLSYLGHALVENRNGLIAAAMVTHADGYAERDAALLMLERLERRRRRRITVGADKAYDTKDFVRTPRELNVTPARDQQQRESSQYSRPPYHSAAGLCNQPQPKVADREELRMAEADRTAATDEVARTGQSGLAVRLQLRRSQPAPPAEAVVQPPSRLIPASGARLAPAAAPSTAASDRLRPDRQLSPRHYKPAVPNFNKLLV